MVELAQGGPGLRSESGVASGLLALLGRPVVLLALVTLLGAGAGAFGYLRAAGDADVDVAVAAAMPPGAPASAASAATTKPSSARPVVADAKSPLLWPLWEYQLEDPVPARDPPLTPVNWQLLGATLSQGGWEIVVMRQGKTQPEYFKVGDKLPGGYRVRDINQENVTLVAGRREIVLAYIGSR